ncbi:MAG: hypothetical protein RLZZ628_2108 [Bacteroidota bacterium]
MGNLNNVQDNYRLLMVKLDQFIRKYYVNQLIRGTLYSVGLLLALFIGLNVAEHYFYFETATRKWLFWSFVGVSATSLVAWMGLPLMHYFRLGKTLSHEQAAQIIGEHFVGVKDKLLNIIQLKKQADETENRDLIVASIRQKSEQIKLVPFKKAINLYQNKKYLRFALPPTLLFLFMLFAAPSILKNGTFRFLNYNTAFEKPAPFKFTVENPNLQVVQFQDFDLKVKADGTILPNDVYISINGYEYRMQKEDATTFTYKFSNVQKEMPFRLFSGTVTSMPYMLNVLKKPNIAGFEVKLDYPEYTGRPDESLPNTGDLIVPQGTNIAWALKALHTERVVVHFGNNVFDAAKSGDEGYTFSKQLMKDEIYKLFISNSFLPNADSVAYTITVIPDLYPTIQVQKFEDSTKHVNKNTLFFAGDASDDYGLKSLTFNYQVKPKGGTAGALQKLSIEKPAGKFVPFQYSFNTENLKLQAGDEITYYFEVYDNDAVNGSKSAKTNPMLFSVATVEQVEKLIAKNNDEIRDELKKALEESRKIQEDTKKLHDKLLQKKEPDFQMKKEAEQLMKRQEQLDKQIDKAKDNFQENMEKSSENEKQNQDIREKQEQLQKMFEDLKNDKMKDLLKQIEEMMQKMEKDRALNKMDSLKFSNEELNRELDRMQELFKQLEVESMQQEQLDKLDEMAQKQEELSKEAEQKDKNSEDLKQKQDNLNKDFKKFEEKQKDLEKKNKELERPKEMEDTKEDSKEVEKEQQDSKESLEQKQNAKASKSQKKAADKMKNMANKMKQKMADSEQEQAEEDMKAMRQLLENLVQLSFDQEKLMDDFKKTGETTPRFVKLTQQQHKLKNDFELVEDSLHALSKRVLQIQTFVNEKVTDIKQDMFETLKELEDRKKYAAEPVQQRTMKNLNDLALMLSESMSQMQQQQQSQSNKPGNKACKKPGNGQGKTGKMPKDKVGEGQKDLNKMLKDLKDRMGKGGKGGMSKEFAQMAAKQAALRQALKEKQKEMQQRGKGADKGMEEIAKDMEKTETELVNKVLTNETLKRQEAIETRLLESDKAERERKEDEQRKGEVAKTRQPDTPPNLQEYLRKRQAEVELYRSSSPSLKPYYKGLVEDYFKNLKGK